MLHATTPLSKYFLYGFAGPNLMPSCQNIRHGLPTMRGECLIGQTPEKPAGQVAVCVTMQKSAHKQLFFERPWMLYF
jgi:hypothetical protein|tara:strand:+ start:635 stop:865 length:231 start_codon:yes stop_codon:yes gene_type:complete